MKVLTQALTLILILALALIAGCGSDTENTAKAETYGQVTSGAAVAVGSTPGAMAPDFTLKNLAGGNLTLSDLRLLSTHVHCRSLQYRLPAMTKHPGDPLNDCSSLSLTETIALINWAVIAPPELRWR